MSTRNLGKVGENLAADFLQRKGYRILQRNFNCKLGEIDIVCLEKETLVFVEVKTRWNKAYGPPEEAITPWKIRSIIKTGEYFKLLHPKLPNSLRLDAVVIEMENNNVTRIELIKSLTS